MFSANFCTTFLSGAYAGGGDGVLEHPSAEVQSTFSHNVILKMIATSGFLTALECTKFVFGRGSAPDPLAGLRGPTFKERGGEGKKWVGEGGEGERTGGDEREGEGKESRNTPSVNFCVGPLIPISVILSLNSCKRLCG